MNVDFSKHALVHDQNGELHYWIDSDLNLVKKTTWKKILFHCCFTHYFFKRSHKLDLRKVVYSAEQIDPTTLNSLNVTNFKKTCQLIEKYIYHTNTKIFWPNMNLGYGQNNAGVAPLIQQVKLLEMKHKHQALTQSKTVKKSSFGKTFFHILEHPEVKEKLKTKKQDVTTLFKYLKSEPAPDLKKILTLLEAQKIDLKSLLMEIDMSESPKLIQAWRTCVLENVFEEKDDEKLTLISDTDPSAPVLMSIVLVKTLSPVIKGALESGVGLAASSKKFEISGISIATLNFLKDYVEKGSTENIEEQDLQELYECAKNLQMNSLLQIARKQFVVSLKNSLDEKNIEDMWKWAQNHDESGLLLTCLNAFEKLPKDKIQEKSLLKCYAAYEKYIKNGTLLECNENGELEWHFNPQLQDKWIKQIDAIDALSEWLEFTHLFIDDDYDLKDPNAYHHTHNYGTKTFLQTFLAGVPEIDTLKSISVQNCSMKDDELNNLLPFLKKNRSLETVDLRQNLLSFAGAEELAKYISDHPLKRLYISNNRDLTDKGMLFLIDPKISLEFLEGINNFSATQRNEVIEALCENQYLKKIDLGAYDLLRIPQLINRVKKVNPQLKIVNHE